MKRVRHPKPAPARSCGHCTACCTVLGVVEISKPVGTPCFMLAKDGEGHGCASYEVRPPSCKGWSCLWLLGGIEASARPDQVGAVFDRALKGKDCIVAREAFPGGFEKAEPLIEDLARTFIVFTIAWDGKRAVRGPHARRDEIGALIEQAKSENRMRLKVLGPSMRAVSPRTGEARRE